MEVTAPKKAAKPSPLVSLNALSLALMAATDRVCSLIDRKVVKSSARISPR